MSLPMGAILKRPTWMALFLVGPTLIVMAAVSIRACVRASCYEAVLSSSLSPDGSHEARLTEVACATGPYGSTSYFLSVRRANSSDVGEEFYAADTPLPEYVWSDAQHLIVTIKVAPLIFRSQREAEGVIVNYKLAENLSEQEFKRELQVWEDRALAKHSKSPVAVGRRDTELEAINFAKANRRTRFEQFKDWARKNIPGSYQ